MKLQKLALTALALSMSTAFAGNTDKQAESSSSNPAPMAQSASANQPSSSTANETASSSTNEASGTNGSQSGMPSHEGATAQADPQVRQVQQALKDKGFDPGQVDGIMGPETKQALQSFQQAQGISGSGELDQRTLAALGVQGDSLAGNASTSQPANANPSAMGNTDKAYSSGANQPSSDQGSSSSANQDSSSNNPGYTKQ